VDPFIFQEIYNECRILILSFEELSVNINHSQRICNTVCVVLLPPYNGYTNWYTWRMLPLSDGFSQLWWYAVNGSNISNY